MDFMSEEARLIASGIQESGARDAGRVAAYLLATGNWRSGLQETLWRLAAALTESRDGPSVELRLDDLRRERERLEVGDALASGLDMLSRGEIPALDTLLSKVSASRVEAVPTSDLVRAHLERLTAAAMGKPTPSPVLPMGPPFASLNRITGGGWRRGAINIVAARPGSGKSSFVEQESCYQARQGRRVLFVPLEMGQSFHAERIMTRTAFEVGGEAAAQALWEPVVSEGKRVSKHHHALMSEVELRLTHGGLPSWLEVQPHVDSICSAVMRQHALSPIDMLIVDYFQMIDGGQTGGKQSSNRNYELAAAAKKLLSLAKKTNSALVLVAQFNRGIEGRDNKTPKLRDLADCGEMDNFTHTAIFLSKEESSSPKVSVTFTIGKARTGSPHSQTDLMFNGPGISFYSADDVSVHF
jgi:replicative DNA helicase